MSRLGAAGAVVPLITDGQAEVPNSCFFKLMHILTIILRSRLYEVRDHFIEFRIFYNS